MSKWLLMGGYNPNKECISYFLSHVSKIIDMCLKDYENMILIDDFNSTVYEHSMSEFCQIYNLHNLINEPTC